MTISVERDRPDEPQEPVPPIVRPFLWESPSGVIYLRTTDDYDVALMVGENGLTAPGVMTSTSCGVQVAWENRLQPQDKLILHNV